MIMTLVCSKISTKLSAQLGNEALCIMMAHFIQPREKQKSRDSLLQNETFVICYRLNFPCRLKTIFKKQYEREKRLKKVFI